MTKWHETRLLGAARSGHRAVLLPAGVALVAGGWTGSSTLGSSEYYMMGLGYGPAWRPVLSAVRSPLALGQTLWGTGSGFRGYGLTEASGGTTQGSPTNHPVVQLYRLDNGQVSWLTTRTFVTWAFVTTPVVDAAPGHALATVFVNGIPSVSQIILVGPQRTYLPMLHRQGS